MSVWTETILGLHAGGELEPPTAAALADAQGIERTRMVKTGAEVKAWSARVTELLFRALREDLAHLGPVRVCSCALGPEAPRFTVLDQKRVEHVPGCMWLEPPVDGRKPAPGYAWCPKDHCCEMLARGAGSYLDEKKVIHTDGGCGEPRGSGRR